jgi:hypothetical protein
MTRLLSHVEVDPTTGCWLWTGETSWGYGRIGVGSRGKGTYKHEYAHRFAYETVFGGVPPGMVLDHFKCERPLCVNPEHVRPATNRDNFLRTNPIFACPRGHPYPENMRFNKKNERVCRACWVIKGRERYRLKVLRERGKEVTPMRRRLEVPNDIAS